MKTYSSTGKRDFNLGLYFCFFPFFFSLPRALTSALIFSASLRPNKAGAILVSVRFRFLSRQFVVVASGGSLIHGSLILESVRRENLGVETISFSPISDVDQYWIKKYGNFGSGIKIFLTLDCIFDIDRSLLTSHPSIAVTCLCHVSLSRVT